SAASVTAALNTANTVLADEDATQAQVNAAASELNSAVAALVELNPTVDKSQLQSAVNAAAAIDLSLYTAASAASVTAALNTANTVLADEDATQAQVDAAASGLNNAVAALVELTPAEGTFISGTYQYRNYKLYVPGSYVSGTDMPMMVMLHAGAQDPDIFASETQMNDEADARGFFVLYPDQPYTANYTKCWNWFLTADQTRGSGEAAIIAGITTQVMSQYSIDESRVYVSGLGAGGAMAVIMGATYPDLYSGIGVAEGLEYKAATSTYSAYLSMISGGPSPATQGQLAYNAMGNYADVIPVIVFQGSADTTVYPVNGNQVISQWAKTNDLADDGTANNSIDDTADTTITGTVNVPDGKSYTQYIYEDGNGNTVMEKYIVNGMGYAWSGGSADGVKTDPTGPDMTNILCDFFLM
ncbi:MAG: PHB depolymerase family esterase, partial [Oscillospiraceae bacterium]|nr:PHB depolymerase family esterase [Oscillospiraceae bacterium]